MDHEMAAMFAGYMAGVIFGSTVSITIYRMLVETGKLKPFGIS